jgi:hypothetical protein
MTGECCGMRGEYTTASNDDTLTGQRRFDALLQHLRHFYHNTCTTKQFLLSSVMETRQLRTSLNSRSDSIARRTRSSFEERPASACTKQQNILTASQTAAFPHLLGNVFERDHNLDHLSHVRQSVRLAIYNVLPCRCGDCLAEGHIETH